MDRGREGVTDRGRDGEKREGRKRRRERESRDLQRDPER